MQEKQRLINEIRYAERICQRTARLYRRVQSVGTWLAVVSGSATLSAISDSIPQAVATTGAVIFAMTGAALLAIRPADKAAANESDMRKYSNLRASSTEMNAQQLEIALEKARLSDVQEVEPLRDVAYNDVVAEYGRSEYQVPLTTSQKILAALA